MSFSTTMNTMLPPVNGTPPHITGRFGEPRPAGPHGGIDFNYVGGQTGVNMEYPLVRSPVSGTIIFAGGEDGTIIIRDDNGFIHKIYT